MFLNKYIFTMSRQTLKLEEYSWLAIHDCLFNTIHSELTSKSGGLLSHPQPKRMRHALLTGTHRQTELQKE